MLSSGGVRQRVVGFMNQSPLDSNMTRRVKMAANVIDRFGFVLVDFLSLNEWMSEWVNE